jgi:Spx/MgsR family transcriptional regulator
MRAYLYSKCSTCKDALRFINDRKIQVEIREITITPPSLKELNDMLNYQEGNLKKLFNTSGNLYRAMRLAEQLDGMPVQKALELLTKHGMLIKRPFLIGNGFGLTGFNKVEWSKMLECLA